MRGPARRRATLPPYRPKGPNGERYCRRCGDVLTGQRTAWCSEDCSLKARIEAGWQGAAREWLWKREHGVCQACGLDTADLAAWLTRLLAGGRRWRLPTYRDSIPIPDGERPLAALRDLRSRGFDVFWNRRKAEIWTLWQADHRVPIIEGGALAAENLQTLCVPCHKADTAELARRRARRRAKQLSIWE